MPARCVLWSRRWRVAPDEGFQVREDSFHLLMLGFSRFNARGSSVENRCARGRMSMRPYDFLFDAKAFIRNVMNRVNEIRGFAHEFFAVHGVTHFVKHWNPNALIHQFLVNLFVRLEPFTAHFWRGHLVGFGCGGV
jgi:hypothetical protein